MKTRNKLIVLSLLLMGIIFTSCEEEFLERVPTDAVSAVSATATTGNLNLLLNGINRSLYIRYGAQGRTGIQSIMIQNDVVGDDYVMNARANGWFIGTGQWLSHTSALSANDDFPYRVYYRIIRNANTIIEGAADADGPQEERDVALGRALTYRAWAHLQLVQLFGGRYVPGGNNSQAGVVIRTTTLAEPQARNTVEEVYTQIHADLAQAIPLLEDAGRGGGSNIGQGVAQGLEARAYLVQGNYTMAAQFAVAARSGFSLMNEADYFNNFTDLSSSEWMWGSTIQEDQTDLFGNYGAWVSRNFSSSNIRGNPKSINSLLYAQISPTDVRARLFSVDGTHPDLPAGVDISSRHQRFPYTNQKFIAAGTGDSRMDQPYMRISEMYLIEAEALARMGQDGPAAQALLPMAQARDAAYTLSANTGQALIDEILIQRRVELWGEGFRFYDLKRMDLPLNRDFANSNFNPTQSIIETVPAGDPRWQWLIPQRALDNNPLLVQN